MKKMKCEYGPSLLKKDRYNQNARLFSLVPQAMLSVLASDKRSSLLCLSISDDEIIL
jgi:hypothetical protein